MSGTGVGSCAFTTCAVSRVRSSGLWTIRRRPLVLTCVACHRSYPVFEGIPSFIPSPASDRSMVCQLTVLVPALNEAANLKELLPSIQRELESLAIDHELIVVDGGSTDGTAEVVA